MKKILVHYAVDRNGGEFRRIARLCKDYDATHDCITHEVVFLPLLCQNYTGDNLLGESLSVYRVILPFRRFSFVRRINRFLIRSIVLFLVKKYEPDILWGETLNGFNAIRDIRGISKYIDIHGAAPEEAQYIYDNPELVSELNTLEEMAVRQTDKIVVQSASMKEHLISKHHKFGFAEKITVYNCGVDTNLFDYHKISIPEERKHKSISADDIVFVYAGGVQKWQSVFESILIFKKIHFAIPDTKFIMLIQGDKSVVEKYCSDNDVPDVKIYQNIPFTDVHIFLSMSDFAWILRENVLLNRVASPTKLGEYLACGQVLITTEVAHSWPYIKNNLENIIMVDRDDIPGSADKVVAFIKEHNLSARRKETLRKIAIDNLSSDIDRLNISSM